MQLVKKQGSWRSSNWAKRDTDGKWSLPAFKIDDNCIIIWKSFDPENGNVMLEVPHDYGWCDDVPEEFANEVLEMVKVLWK